MPATKEFAMKRYLRGLILISLGLAACGRNTAPTPTPLPTISSVDRQTRVLDTLWRTVNDQYIYTDFGGADWEALRAEYKTQIDGGLTHDQFELAMAAMVDNLPNDSVVYQTRSERIELELGNTSLYSGIGAYITVRTEPEPHIIIMSIVADSPAAQAGLKAHDSIYSIDGAAVTEEEGLNVVQRVRGEAGTTVSLEVESPDGTRRKVEVTRAKLNAADSLDAFVLGETDIAYLRFPVTPGESFIQQLAGVMQTIGERGDVRGLVLDLRVARSGGGWPLNEMLALFGDGRLGEYYSRERVTPIEVEGVNIGGSQELPVVILVGPDTEGPPEIFAAALQDAKRAAVIGLPTSGRIFGYDTVPLPDGSRLTLAVSSFKTGLGRDLGETGIEPDLVVEADWDQVEPGNDPPLEMAAALILDRQ
jgi:carboxyl-terminal processing protease